MSGVPPIVFLGPTLPVATALDVLDAEYLPPAELGDVWRVTQEQPPAIGIVDGYFNSVPAVWHKEILFALSSGIPVYGAASMGALRAAELARFGMVGVGRIAEGYCSDELTCDDEVALVHAGAEHGYQAFSEPLVNIRATMSAAVEENLLERSVADAVVGMAQSLFYPDRTWERLLEVTPAPAEVILALRRWLPTGRVDQKRIDAIAMLERMRDDGTNHGGSRASRPATFTTTVPWMELVRNETPIAAILEEFLMGNPLSAPVLDALDGARHGEATDWFSVLSVEPDWPNHCRRARRKAQQCGATVHVVPGFEDADRVLAWFFGERLGWPEDLDAFLRIRGWTDPRTVIAIAAREAAFASSTASDERPQPVTAPASEA